MNGVWDSGDFYRSRVRHDQNTFGHLRVVVSITGTEPALKLWVRCHNGDAKGDHLQQEDLLARSRTPFKEDQFASEEEARDSLLAWLQGEVLRERLYDVGTTEPVDR